MGLEMLFFFPHKHPFSLTEIPLDSFGLAQALRNSVL